MSGVGAPKGVGARVVQGGTLLLLFALFWAGKKVAPEASGHATTIASVGLLLLAGTLVSELVEPLGLPHLTGYLGAGLLAGPYVLRLVDEHAVKDLSVVNALALALIALSGGAELRLDVLRRTARSIAWGHLFQTLLIVVGMSGVFLALRGFMPFLASLSFTAAVGVALMWGTLSVTRSPSACLGILAQTRAKGPLADFSLSFIMASDVLVIVLLAGMMALTRPLIEPSAQFALTAFVELGHDLIGSIAIGTTMGLILAAYLRLVDRELILVMVALGFGGTEVLNYLRFDTLLSFIVAGFVVQNLTNQGEKLLHAVERTSAPVFILFFATAGADLDIPLLGKLWPVAVALAGGRMIITWIAARLGSRAAKDAPALVSWGWSSLVSQAGLALGIAVVIERSFPAFGEGFRSLAVATVAINEVVGPILFKLALDRAGETSRAPAVTRPSLTPPNVATPLQPEERGHVDDDIRKRRHGDRLARAVRREPGEAVVAEGNDRHVWDRLRAR